MALSRKHFVGALATVALAPLLSQCAQQPATTVKQKATSIRQQNQQQNQQLGDLNPVDLVRLAGATPPPGSTKGNSYPGGVWYANGSFPAAPAKAEAGALTTIVIYVFPNRGSLEKTMQLGNVVNTNSSTVMVGNNGRFYAIMTGVINIESGKATFDVPPATVAKRLGATLVS